MGEVLWVFQNWRPDTVAWLKKNNVAVGAVIVLALLLNNGWYLVFQLNAVALGIFTALLFNEKQKLQLDNNSELEDHDSVGDYVYISALFWAAIVVHIMFVIAAYWFPKLNVALGGGWVIGFLIWLEMVKDEEPTSQLTGG